MKIKKLETIRIEITDEIYCDIIPSLENDNYHDFVLLRKGYGVYLHMFSEKIKSEEDAIQLVEANANDYIDDLLEACED